MAARREQDRTQQPPEYLVVGEIVAPFGTQGEVKVLLDTDFPELVTEAKQLYVGEPPTCWLVERARLHRGVVRLKLARCDGREAAEALRGQLLQVRVAEAPIPAEGEYYYYQLVGLQVWTVEGDLLGKVVEVFSTGSNEVLVVQGGGEEILLPALAEVVREVDLAAGRIQVCLIEGLR